MHEPTYRKALGEAWRLVVHHPVLWVLGILAIFTGQFGVSNFVGQLVSLQDVGTGYWQLTGYSVQSWQGGVGLVWLAFLVLGVVIALVLMSVAAQGALITSTAEWYHTRETPDFAGAWHRGVKHFWRLLLVSVLRKAALLCILIVVGFWGERMLAVWNLGGAVASATIMTFGLLAGLTVAAVAMYTAGYVVTEERTLGQSLVRAWRMFHHHIVVSFEVSLLLLVISIALIISVLFVSALTLVPSFIGMLAAGITGAGGFIGIGLFVSLLLFVMLVVFVGGFFNAYSSSVWMYLFMKMHNEGMQSHIFRWFAKLRS